MNKKQTPIEFSRELIKGRIAEVIFEQMIREEDRYTVIPFGYEHTMPTLAQYRHLADIPKIIDKIADAPDFALISKDQTKVYLVEVKFQSRFNYDDLIQHADKLLERWEYPWIFVASPDGFRCGLCRDIKKDGRINDLSDNWVSRERREQYLKLLNEFEK